MVTRAFILILLGAVSALAIAPPAAAMPNIKCALMTPVQEVQHITQMAPELVKLLPPMADIGAPFNSGDSISDPNAPFRRLIRAGNHGSDWFVWYEHGGIGYSWQAVTAHVEPGAQSKVMANAGMISDTLCTVTDGAFAGRVPPYPPGTWAASDF